MTGRTANVKLKPPTTLDISPPDAKRLGIVSGEKVRLRSHHGEAEIEARIEPGVRPGELFATFHAVKVYLNRVMGTGRDPATHTPEYKVTAVRVEKLRAQGITI
jgi:formate dehydrogenase major subunit